MLTCPDIEDLFGKYPCHLYYTKVSPCITNWVCHESKEERKRTAYKTKWGGTKHSSLQLIDDDENGRREGNLLFQQPKKCSCLTDT